MRTSVVMATYNGAEFIYDQLSSLLAQTRLIDEVLIIDDCSTDNTVSIIHEFIQNNQLDNWEIKVNEKNIGWRNNFINLIKRATGDVIFTCDQDDIWHSNKIEAICSAMDKNSQIKVIVSDYTELVQDRGVAEIPKKIESVATKDEDVGIIPFHEKSFFLRRPGCVFALRSDFRKDLMTYISGFEFPTHDLAMWGTSILTDGLYHYHEALIDWRKHGLSSIRQEDNRVQLDDYDLRIRNIRRQGQRLHAGIRFLSYKMNKQEESINNFDKKYKTLSQMSEECQMRAEVLSKRSLVSIVFSAIKYHRLFNFFADVYHVLKL